MKREHAQKLNFNLYLNNKADLNKPFLLSRSYPSIKLYPLNINQKVE